VPRARHPPPRGCRRRHGPPHVHERLGLVIAVAQRSVQAQGPLVAGERLAVTAQVMAGEPDAVPGSGLAAAVAGLLENGQGLAGAGQGLLVASELGKAPAHRVQGDGRPPAVGAHGLAEQLVQRLQLVGPPGEVRRCRGQQPRHRGLSLAGSACRASTHGGGTSGGGTSGGGTRREARGPALLTPPGRPGRHEPRRSRSSARPPGHRRVAAGPPARHPAEGRCQPRRPARADGISGASPGRRPVPAATAGRRPARADGTRGGLGGRPPETTQCPWPWPLGAAGSASGLSVTRTSVVSSMPAMEAAFWTADRVTFTGSMTPCATRSPYSPVAAL
jgi:hypothetical protein